MPKSTSSYHSWLVEKLKVPQVAESYLRTALDDSQEAFLTALRNVAEARGEANVAEYTGLNRESLYRPLSSEGNPTLNTLSAVLDAVGLKIVVAEKQPEAPPVPPMAVPSQVEVNASVRIFTGTNLDSNLVSAWTTTNAFMNSAKSTTQVFATDEVAGGQIPDVPAYMLGAQIWQKQEARQG